MTSNAEFYVLQGNGFTIEVPFLYDDKEPVDMRGYTVRCAIIRNYGDTKHTELVPTQSATENHIINLSLSSMVTGGLYIDKYHLNLDIRETGSDEWIPILSGILEVQPNANHIT